MKSFRILLFLSVSLAACKGKQDVSKKNGGRDGAVIVDVIVATPQSVVTTVEANGTVVANEYAELHPEVSGRLTYLNVPEGKLVQQGTVIARIYDADLEAQVNKSKVALDLAEKTEERLRKLLAVGGVNQSDYDAALNAVNGYKADIAYTQSLIEKTIIKAPFTGVVGLRQVSPGAYLSPANVIATIQQLDKIRIDFTVPEEYGKYIKIGGEVDVQIDATTDERRKALILATEPQVIANTRNLKVRAILQHVQVNPGAYVKVYLVTKKDNKAVFVPTNSIIPDDKNKQVVLVRKGKAFFSNVETGVRQADNVEVTTGVKPGDTVVVTGVLFARPQAELKVRSVKTLDQLADQ